MVIDFNRLNSSSSLTGSTRTSNAKESAENSPSAPLNTQAEQANAEGLEVVRFVARQGDAASDLDAGFHELEAGFRSESVV